MFCEAIGEWWPKGVSFKGDRREMIIEGRIGGRFFGRYTDGTEYEIGRVTEYQPPALVAFTWRAPSWDVTTQVRIRFSAETCGNPSRIGAQRMGGECEDSRCSQQSRLGVGQHTGTLSGSIDSGRLSEKQSAPSLSSSTCPGTVPQRIRAGRLFANSPSPDLSARKSFSSSANIFESAHHILTFATAASRTDAFSASGNSRLTRQNVMLPPYNNSEGQRRGFGEPA
jgi:uncharacterized protein YndB with AHSA1/START domain